MSPYNDFNSFYRPSHRPEAEEPQHTIPTTGEVIDDQPIQPKKKRRLGLKITACVLAGVLLLGGAFGSGYAVRELLKSNQTSIYVSNREPVEVTPVAVDGKTAMTFSELYATNVNSCVSINASATTTNIFNQQAQVMASSGSGFIITKDGYIVTNYHIIDGSDTVKVTLYDGTTYDATVVGGDSEYDIAVLKIEADKELTPVVIGDSDELNVGDDVAAIGNPLGELTFSMSEGIVSTTNRLINVDSTPFNMIQITAAVNSGNSGGPLFNIYGEVVGIVSAKLSSSSSSKASVEGLGFAIPINDVVNMLYDIMSNGYVTNKPYLAITAQTFNSSMAPNVPATSGVYVYSVEEGGAADKAGLQAGDVIVKIDDTDITAFEDIEALRKSYTAGDTVTVTFYRGSEEMTTELTFDSMPQTTATDSNSQSSQGNTQQNPYGDNGYFDPWDFFDYFGSSYQQSVA